MYSHSVSNKIIRSLRDIWEMTGSGKWLVAISGGADSTALLLACREARVPVEAVHCNFNLRDEESIRDRDFTVKLCQRLDIPLSVKEFSVAGEALKGESLEMTCRRIRYELFRELAAGLHCDRIAVAHNSDDNAETLFLNLLRGSGTRGLKGMERDGAQIVRPLLGFSRKDIIKFLEEQKQTFIVDSTNLESDYRRNFLRNEVFPLLESRWNGFRNSIRRSQEILERENKIIEHFLNTTLAPYSDFLPWAEICSFPDRETLVFRFIDKFGGTASIASEIARHSYKVYPGKRWTYGDTTFLSTSKGLKVIR